MQNSFYLRKKNITKMSDRKAELERKRAKLAAMKEESKRRLREKEAKDMEDATNKIASGQERDSRR